jgi:hypothetical protein
LDGNCDIGTFFFYSVIEFTACMFAIDDTALEPLFLMTRHYSPQQWQRFQSPQKFLLADTCGPACPSGEVIDALNIVVLAKKCEEPLKIEPLMGRIFHAPIIEIVAIDIDDRSTIWSAHAAKNTAAQKKSQPYRLANRLN